MDHIYPLFCLFLSENGTIISACSPLANPTWGCCSTCEFILSTNHACCCTALVPENSPWFKETYLGTLHNSFVCCRLRLKWLAECLCPLLDFFKVLPNESTKIAEINEVVMVEGLPYNTLEHGLRDLFLASIIILFIQLVGCLGDPQAQKNLLIYHFLSLLHLGHPLKFCKHVLGPERRMLDLWSRVIGDKWLHRL